MNRNIFARRPPVLQNENITRSEPYINNELEKEYKNQSGKHNPDVMEDYMKIKDMKMTDIEIKYSNVTWKSITNCDMDFNPAISSNFICAKDTKEYEKIKSETELELDEREKERLEELLNLESIKKQQLNLILEMDNEICKDEINNNEVIFNDLKINSDMNLSNNLQCAKDDFNALLSGISKL